MAAAMLKHGMTLTHIIGPQTGHKYHPDSKVEINKRIDAIVEKGRERVPLLVKFTTFTLTMAAGDCPQLPGMPVKVTVDGQAFDSAPVNKDRSWSAHFLKIKDRKWAKLDSRYGHLWDKQPGLQ